MKASNLFIKALENEGVEYIFGIPGEENLDLIESLKNSKIKLILTRHEQAAGFMAATYGRLTGKAGVCLSTLGPGATNLVTAGAYAQLGGMPMLMITGQKPIGKSKQGHFQIINTVEMMKPITKFTRQIVNGKNIPSLVREAFRRADEERPGAVHLELPEDIAREEVKNYHIFERNKTYRPAAEEKAIKVAVKMIEKAKRPLILVGAGANRKLISKHLVKLVQKTKIPFFNTQMGKGVMGKIREYYIGTASLSDKDFIHCAIKKADLIVNIGHDIIEKPPFFMKDGGTKVIHINFIGAKVDEVYFPQLEIIGDISNSLWQITEKIKPNKDWDFDDFMKVKKSMMNNIESNGKDNHFPLRLGRVVYDVREAMPKDSIVTLDNGIYKILFSRNYGCYEQNSLLLDNALATMGAGLPSAIGARFVHPKKKILSVCGDGGFMMNSQELETAVRYKLNLVIVILNDSSYGMIKWKQENMGMENWGLDFGNPDFVKYAESYGAKGYRVSKSGELSSLIEKCINSKGVHLIDVPVDYSENKKIFDKLGCIEE